MTSRCANDCGGYAGRGYSKCEACRVEEYNGFRTANESRDSEPDELEYECVNCGEVYVGTLGDDCPACGSPRCRYAGPLANEEVATDGGRNLVPARIDYDDLVGQECPVCDELLTTGTLNFDGTAWFHTTEPHRISETIDEAGLVTDGGVDTSVDGTDRDNTSMKKVPMSEMAREHQLFWHVLIPRRAFTGHHCANTLTESSAIAYTVRRSRSLMDRSLTSFRLEERTNTHTRKTPRTARTIRSTPHTFFSIQRIRPVRQKHFSGGEYA